MPYQQFTTVPVHMPMRKYNHYVIITEAFEIEKQFVLENRPYQTFSTIKAGIYGFTSLDKRDNFISIANRSSEHEIAFIAAVEQGG